MRAESQQNSHHLSAGLCVVCSTHTCDLRVSSRGSVSLSLGKVNECMLMIILKHYKS